MSDSNLPEPYRPQPHQPYQGQHQPQPYGQPYPPGPPAPTASPKSPGVAVILSVLIPGLGHLYSGNPLFAVMWFVLAGLAGLSLTILIGFVLLPMVWIGACVHAYVSTQGFNRRHHVIR